MRTLTYNLQKNTVTVNLDDKTITVHVQGRTFTSVYPVRIEEVETYLIDLMIWITFYGFGENKEGVFNGERTELPPSLIENPIKRDCDKIMIEYSGGVDSSAAYLILPKEKTVCVNTYRTYDDDYNKRQKAVIKEVGGMYVYTDFELIREMYIKDKGFNIGIGYIAPCFPLMNILGCKYMTLGVVWEDHAFWYGEPFSYNKGCSICVSERVGWICEHYGISITLCTAGLSEVWTSRLVNDSHLANLACSCHSGEFEGNICRTCYKCFRKLGFIGQTLDFSNPRTNGYIHHLLSHKPLKMAASCVYGIQHAGYSLPEFQRYMDIDVSFCERYSDYFTKRWNTPEMYEFLVGRFAELGIEPQTAEDEVGIQKFVEAIRNDNLYKF